MIKHCKEGGSEVAYKYVFGSRKGSSVISLAYQLIKGASLAGSSMTASTAPAPVLHLGTVLLANGFLNQVLHCAEGQIHALD